MQDKKPTFAQIKDTANLYYSTTIKMDAGPSYSYQHDIKSANLVISEGKQICMATACHLLFCNYTS